ncbi:hypothetical protein FKM82_023649 [Ascaphus truei]
MYNCYCILDVFPQCVLELQRCPFSVAVSFSSSYCLEWMRGTIVCFVDVRRGGLWELEYGMGSPRHIMIARP